MIDSETKTRFSFATWISWMSGLLGSTAKRGLMAIGDQAIVSGTNFLTTVLVGRFCGLTQLGAYSIGFGISVLLLCTQQSLIINPFAVFGNRLSGRRRERYKGSVLVQQGLFMVASFAVLLVASILALTIRIESLTTGLIALTLAIPMISLGEFVRRLLLAELDVSSTIVFDGFACSLRISALLILGLAGGLSAAIAFIVMGCSGAIPAIIWLLYRKSEFRINKRVIRPTLKRHWRFGRWMCASQLTDVVQNHSLNWILAASLGLAAAGVYTACASIVMLFNPILLALGSLLLPRSAQVHHQAGVSKLRNLIGKATLVVCVVLIVLGVPIIVFGDSFVHLLYELQVDQPIRPLIVILVATVFVGGVSIAVDSGLAVLERPDVNFYSGLVGLALTCTLAPILANMLGVEGAAVGALIAVIAAVAIQVLGFLVLSDAKRKEAMPA